MQKMGIGEFARMMHVSIRTLQYYDQINLLKPSYYSEGGRRYYTAKESVLFLQIKSMKQMGLSLDQIQNQVMDSNNIEEIKALIHRQKLTLQHKIEDLKVAYTALCKMEEEIQDSDDLNYESYMDILNKMLTNPSGYWVYQSMDDTLNEHILNRFSDDTQSGMDIYYEWNALSEKTIDLMERHILPESKEAQQVASSWWGMVMRFTGGDIGLLPHLEEFNNTKSQWDRNLANRQLQIDDYIGQALSIYMERAHIIDKE